MAAPQPWDVLICGGGMAGLTLALQLRRELPDLRVAIVERSRRPLPLSCHKVGESNAELGSLYLERLGLREYLRREHVVKLGLRFFPGGGELPLEERTEMGPSQEPRVSGYQLDRGRFEQDLRGMVEEHGATLMEGTVVRDVVIGSPHAVSLETDGTRTQVAARWVVDATGRSALLRRRLLTKRGTSHVGHAAWFRVDERIDPSELVSAPSPRFAEVPLASERWRSTTHLMGHGYWVWLINLPTQRTSVGVVTHETAYGFDAIRTQARALEFLREHEPVLEARLRDATLLDFRCIRGYGHRLDHGFSTQRWAIVGDAAAFTDPLYSPGTDFIGLANTFTVELLRADAAGEDLAPLVAGFDGEYQRLVEGSTAVYQQAAPVYAHARAMAAKTYYDNFSYWSYNCQYFVQRLYRLRGEEAETVRALRRRFIELSSYVQTLLRLWATHYPEPPKAEFVSVPSFPSLVVDAHLDLQKTLTPEETVDLMRTRLAQAEQIVAELVVRTLLELGPDAGHALLREAGHADWTLALDPDRAAGEHTIGLKRRRTLSRVVRDVERSLGRVQRHPQWETALRGLPTSAGAPPSPAEAQRNRNAPSSSLP